MNGICEKCIESAQQAVAAEQEKAFKADYWKRMHDECRGRITELEAALRQCVDAMVDHGNAYLGHYPEYNEAINKAQEVLK